MSREGNLTIRPSYTVEPLFILLVGICLTISQQVVQYPLGLLQNIHYSRPEVLDQELKNPGTQETALQCYRKAYKETFRQCATQAQKSGGWARWLYRGFFTNTARQILNTSAGLINFETMRRRYADENESVRIRRDGCDMLVN